MGGRQAPPHVIALHQMIQEQVKSPENMASPLGFVKFNAKDAKDVYIAVYRGGKVKHANSNV